MKMNLYSVKDLATDKCGPIFESETDETAKRSFTTMLLRIPAYYRKDMLLIKLGVRENDSIYSEKSIVDYDFSGLDKLMEHVDKERVN